MPNQPKTKGRTVRVDDDTWAAVEAEAKRQGIRASDVVRKALRNHLGLLLVALVLTGCGGTAQAASSTHKAVAAVVASTPVAPASAVVRCVKPAPSTAAGYAALWSTVPVDQWGAADLSISVPLPDGRVVWLYGDTMSQGRFVHSTAITQDRGCLHVSHAGAQLLPNDDPHHIYWIQSATADQRGLRIVARSVSLVGTGAWDFRDGGYSRTAHAKVDAAGNVTFVGWVGGKTFSKAPNPGELYPLPGKCHFGYSRQEHPEAVLASGRTLVTMAQNWDCGPLRPFDDYRPLWSQD